MSRYAIAGNVTNELLTFGGCTIVHDDRSEMEFLLPLARIVRVSDGDIGPILWLKDHPDFGSVEWPLNPQNFI